MSEPHTCQCYVCHPEAFPPVPAVGARYVGLHVQAPCRNPPQRVPAWATTLDGQPAWAAQIEFNGEPTWEGRGPGVTEGLRSWCITEACEGVIGWVVRTQRYEQGHYDCRCGSGAPCAVVEYGRVRIMMREPTHV